jgi:hypothetical protein
MMIDVCVADVAQRDNTQAIEAIERTLVASEALRAELLRGEASARTMLEELHDGMAFADVVQMGEPSAAELRERASDPLDCYREARRLVRMAMIEDCLRAGMSRGRIAALLGVTRQRVTMLAKDLDVPGAPVSGRRMLRRT